MSEHDANRALAARGVTLLADPTLEDTQRMDVVDRRTRQREGRVISEAYKAPPAVTQELRERRKPSTVGERQPLATSDPEGHRQAIVDFINQGSTP